MENVLGSPYQTIQSKTADYTVMPVDDLILVSTASGAVTITLYTPAGNYGNVTKDSGRVRVMKTNAGGASVTIATAAGAIVGGSLLYSANQVADFLSDGQGTWYNLSAPGDGGLQEAQVALSAAQINAIRTTPVEIVPAPAAGKIVLVEHIAMKMVRTATAFANGGAVEFRYTDGSGAKVSADISASLVTGAAGTAYSSVSGVATELTPVAAAKIVVTCATADFITGTGTGQVTVLYKVVTP